MKTIQEKPYGRFIMLYADGSGCNLFREIDDGYVDVNGEVHSEDDFEDMGYFNWIPVPDSFKFWYELKGE